MKEIFVGKIYSFTEAGMICGYILSGIMANGVERTSILIIGENKTKESIDALF
jgi:hypothetical protein